MHHYIKKLLEETLQISNVVIETPKNRDFGHFATPLAFSLAKTLKKSPKEIAGEISKKITDLDIFSSVENVNGYLNFTLSKTFLNQQANLFLEHPQKSLYPIKTEKILLEYVSANPTGPLHIGHARGAIFGDSLCRLGRYLGYDITTEYYINDAGAQIEMLGNSILLAGRDFILKQEVQYPDSYYKGEYIVDIANAATKKFGKDVFCEKNLELLGNFGKELMLEEIKQNLAQMRIAFDSFVSEKSLYAKWDEILNQLQSHSAVYQKDEKLWLKSQIFGDEKDRVIVRENGEPTYLAGDIIYHYDKFSRKYDHYINIWGADHHGYINRVKASLEHLKCDSKKLEVILAQMVSLLKNDKPYKMSKRAGNFILIEDVIQDIGVDALRFVFLSKTLDTPLRFDVDDLKKEDSSNPIFYINYANARIHTLLSKASQKYDFKQIDLAHLESKDAFHLLFFALQIQRVLQTAFEERALQKVCDFLKELSAQFHQFYNAHKILQTENEAEILKVCLVVSQSLTLGLHLIGIEAKTSM